MAWVRVVAEVMGKEVHRLVLVLIGDWNNTGGEGLQIPQERSPPKARPESLNTPQAIQERQGREGEKRERESARDRERARARESDRE